VKYLLFSDSHLSDRAPANCTNTYLDDLFDLLYQISTLAKESDIVAIVCAGDFFHSKRPDRTSYRTMQRVLEWMRTLSVPFFITPGNHDLSSYRMDSVLATQPLGVLLRAGALLLDGPAQEHPLNGVPWQQSWAEETVIEALRPYRESGRPGLVVAHAPLYPPGKELLYEFFPVSEWSNAMGNTGCCFYGHVHESHGIYEVNGVKFANHGALSRGSLHEHNLTRQVGVTFWESSTEEFEFIPLKAKPASEIFRLVEVQERKDDRAKFEEFLLSASSTTLEMTSIESVIRQVQEMQLGDEFNALAIELLEYVQAKR
jgi:DNA repair exonuclease SbcCD nuclease subunit